MWLGFPSLALLLAQPQTASDAEPKPPVFYETTTVTARPVSGASGAVTVVSSDELATRGARSGSDVLREVPGLNFLASGERAGVTNAWVRGADPNFTLVLLDGIPLNDSTELQGGAVNLEELSADLVGHAEVVRGPLTSFYGPNSLSGVVQLFAPRGGPGPSASPRGPALAPRPPRRSRTTRLLSRLRRDEHAATFGFRRPVVLLPPEFEAMEREQQEAIALHELVHARRGDWLLLVLEDVLTAVLFFHPAVHWLVGRVRLAREQTVDEAVWSTVKLLRHRRQLRRRREQAAGRAGDGDTTQGARSPRPRSRVPRA